MLELYLSLVFDTEYTTYFEEIYYKYEKYVYKIAYYNLNNQHFAEDASQIAFKNIALHIEKIKPLSESAQKCYIYKIAKHAALFVARKNIITPINENEPFKATKNPLDEYEEADKISRIKAYIKSMDLKYKNILFLYFENNLNFKEISDILHISKSTVHFRFSKAMEVLKEKFKEESYDWKSSKTY